MEKVAIIGIGRSSSPDLSFKELIFDAAVRAYDDAGIDPRKDVDSFVSCTEDYWEGFSIFDEFTPDQLGAVLRPLHTVTGDGLYGIINAFCTHSTRYSLDISGIHISSQGSRCGDTCMRQEQQRSSVQGLL
jgi:acetyl-CoA C-acetyltransferase